MTANSEKFECGTWENNKANRLLLNSSTSKTVKILKVRLSVKVFVTTVCYHHF